MELTPDELVQTVAKNLRDRRRELKMSQRDLAAAAGLRQPTIAVVERGKKKLSLETLAAVANALKCPAHFLLTPGAFSQNSA